MFARQNTLRCQGVKSKNLDSGGPRDRISMFEKLRAQAKSSKSQTPSSKEAPGSKLNKTDRRAFCPAFAFGVCCLRFGTSMAPGVLCLVFRSTAAERDAPPVRGDIDCLHAARLTHGPPADDSKPHGIAGAVRERSALSPKLPLVAGSQLCILFSVNDSQGPRQIVGPDRFAALDNIPI